MRLAQLARKIGIKPGEIVTFLADKNLPIEGSSNAKVTEDQLERILTHFAPELLLSHIADEAQEMSGEKIGSSPDLENAEITSANYDNGSYLYPPAIHTHSEYAFSSHGHSEYTTWSSFNTLSSTVASLEARVAALE